MGNFDVAPYILNLVIRDRQVVSFAPRPLYPMGKSPPIPIE
jgi:hypothetical protein